MDNNFSTYMLADQSLRAGAGTLTIAIRLPWYRTLPLSTVRVAQLRIDGEDVPGDRIEFEINGHRRPLLQCEDLIDEQWFVLDDATLHVPGPDLKNQSEHLIDVTLNLHPPYMPGFTWVTHSSKRLQVQR